MTNQLLDQWRADTPACQYIVHLNNAGAALPPLSVQQAVQDYLTLEYQIGGYEAAAARAEQSQAFYTSIADLLNTQSENIAYATSATDAYNKALSCIPWQTGDRILTTENDYVSNQLAFLQLAKRYGVVVERATELPSGGVDTEDFIHRLEQSPPRLAAVTHMPASSGLLQPIAEIGQACQRTGTLYLVDACQTAGQVPLDVQTIHCDFLSATLRKFLRGPRGIGFLYVSDRILTTDWSPSFLDLHSADWTAPDEFSPKPTAQRFETWERNHALQQGAAAAVRYALNVGLPQITERTQQLASTLRDALWELPNTSVQDHGRELGAIVTCYIEGQDPTTLLQHLRQAGVNGSLGWYDYALFDLGRKQIPWVLRLSPHYYNTTEEIQQATKKIFKIIC